MNHQMSSEMQACIDTCQRCHATCLQMLTQHCLEAGGKHVEAAHVRIMLDCIQVCQASADFMLRGSKHHPHICRECAEICEQCAQSCEALDGMEDCVAACRACAESCAKMGEMAA